MTEHHAPSTHATYTSQPGDLDTVLRHYIADPHSQLGARAVGVDVRHRGLAVNGAAGVHGTLELLRQELDQAWGYAAKRMCSTWSLAWLPSRMAGATAPCIRRHQGRDVVLKLMQTNEYGKRVCHGVASVRYDSARDRVLRCDA